MAISFNCHQYKWGCTVYVMAIYLSWMKGIITSDVFVTVGPSLVDGMGHGMGDDFEFENKSISITEILKSSL